MDMERSYWNGTGRLQADAERLLKEHVPASGRAATVEGECLRAAARVHYEFFNNGGGNNCSGCVLFLRGRLPEFDWEWWDALAPYVTGKGCLAEGDAKARVLEACEKMLEATVEFALAREGRFQPSSVDMFGFEVQATGKEIDFPDDDEDEYEDDAEEAVGYAAR